MSVLVRIPTPLRSLTKGQAEVQAAADSVGSLIEDLEKQYPGLKERLVDDGGQVRRFINFYVNEEDIRFLQGAQTALKTGDQVSIVLSHRADPAAHRLSPREGLRDRAQHTPGRRARGPRLDRARA
jgi:sulfur-carrier protein